LTDRPNRANQIRRLPPPLNNNPAKYRRPFWLPASNYYILAAAVTIASFFLIWGILHDGVDDAPWIPAGIGASLILIGAVFLREIVLRKARNRYLLVQKRLDFTLDSVTLHTKTNAPERKLTLEKNAEIIKQIQKKSDAAKILMKLSDGHREVFEICNEYLEINQQELATVGAGSPRLAALRRGREIVGELHRFHLLRWAEIESRDLTQEAKNRATIAEKTETAQKALNVLQTALQHYPDDERLIDSEEAVKEFVISIRVAHFIEQAERSEFKGNYKRAVSHYKDALFFLARENKQSTETDLLAEKINLEIKKILEIPPDKKKKLGTKKRND
jgi:tetratricopeptide (TPR) repeat protein